MGASGGFALRVAIVAGLAAGCSGLLGIRDFTAAGGIIDGGDDRTSPPLEAGDDATPDALEGDGGDASPCSPDDPIVCSEGEYGNMVLVCCPPGSACGDSCGQMHASCCPTFTCSPLAPSCGGTDSGCCAVGDFCCDETSCCPSPLGYPACPLGLPNAFTEGVCCPVETVVGPSAAACSPGECCAPNCCGSSSSCAPFQVEPCAPGSACEVEDPVQEPVCMPVYSPDGGPPPAEHQPCVAANNCAEGFMCIADGLVSAHSGAPGFCLMMCLTPGASFPFAGPDGGLPPDAGPLQGGCPAGETCRILEDGLPSWLSFCGPS